MEKYEYFAGLADKPKSKWKAADREAVVAECAERGIFLNQLCPDCYRDAAAQIALAYKPQDEQADAGGYVLRSGVDVILHSRNGKVFHVCEATLTKDNAELWLANGLNKRAFAQVPNEDN